MPQNYAGHDDARCPPLAWFVIADPASLILPYLWPEPSTHRPGPRPRSLLLYLRRTPCRKRPSSASLVYIISAFPLTTTTTHQKPPAFSLPPFNHSTLPPQDLSRRTNRHHHLLLTSFCQHSFELDLVLPHQLVRAVVPFGLSAIGHCLGTTC